MGTKFEDSFWVVPVKLRCGSKSLRSYLTSVRRMKEGKQFCDDFHSYLKQRAAIEETYGKALMKLGRTAGGLHEMGTLKSSWERLKTATEDSGNLHLTLSKKLTEKLEKPVKEFRERQRDQRKKTEDTVKKAQKYKVTAFDKHGKAKKHYYSKCRESDKIGDELARSQMLPAKELEKLKTRDRKAKQAVASADQSYMDSVRTLEEARVLWEREMERCSAQFQTLEEDRIAYLRRTMWQYVNELSMSSVEDDEKYESVRTVLEKCDVKTDILQFIQMRMTGTTRPPAIAYENFYNKEAPTMSVPPDNSIDKAQKAALAQRQAELEKEQLAQQNAAAQQQQAAAQRLLQKKAEEDKIAAQKMKRLSTASATSASSADAANPFVQAAAATTNSGTRVQVAYDYEAQGEQELTLRVGNIITVISHADDTWSCGELNGKRGMFPIAYTLPHNG